MHSISPSRCSSYLAMLASIVLCFQTGHLFAGDTPTYQAPDSGSPTRRVGGGTRDLGSKGFLAVLAPEHTGYVLNEQPVLYWSSSDDVKWPLAVRLAPLHQADAKSTMETILAPPLKAGIHAFNLAEHGVTLEPNVVYEWTLTLKQRNGQDIITSATIKRVKNKKLNDKPEALPERERPQLYAGAGLWYDAIESLSAQIEEHPNDASLREARASLLTQVGLPQVAELDNLDKI